MAAKREKETVKLTLKVATGTTASGGTTYSSRSVANIAPTASDTPLLNFATSYAALQAHELGSVTRTQSCELVNE